MPTFLSQLDLVLWRDVIGLAELDIELVVRPDSAFARAMIEALLRLRNQLSLGDDDADADVRALIEELRRRILQNAVLLDHVEEPVLGEAGAVRDFLSKRRGELLDLDALGDACAVAVGHRPDLVLARADEGHDALRADRHMACVGNDRVKVDVETGRQGDLLEDLLDRVRLRPGLWNRRPVDGGRVVPGFQCLQIVCPGAAQPDRKSGQRYGRGNVKFHSTLLGSSSDKGFSLRRDGERLPGAPPVWSSLMLEFPASIPPVDIVFSCVCCSS